MKILITGAAGYIGSHLADRLLDAGHQVVGVDCFSPYYERATKERNAAAALERGMTLHEIDLASAALDACCSGVELIYHCAAQPGISASTPFDDYLRNNVVATQRLIETALPSPDLRMFVNLGTSSIYGADATGPETEAPQPTSYYGVTKLAAEQLVLAAQRERDMPACSLRLFSVYGPRERPEKLIPRLVRAISAQTPFPLYEGAREHMRSFTFISDIIDGLALVPDHIDAVNGQILNLGSTLQRSTGWVIDFVESEMGRAANVDTQPRRPGDQLATHANIDRARELLGYAPRVEPEEGLRQAIAWFS